MKSISYAIKQIASSKNIAIICHQKPDADTICSAIALKKMIQQNIGADDKQIDIFVDPQEINEINNAIIKNTEIGVKNCENYDLIICVDCASPDRFFDPDNIFNSNQNTLNIDHHSTNTYFAKNNLVAKTCSTCEFLYLIARYNHFKLSDDICKFIYAGIITDTNNLTQGNVTVVTHKIILEMIERNINLDILNNHFFKNNTKSKAYLLKQALDSMSFMANDRIVFMKLSKQDFQNANATFDDTLGIVNYGIELRGVDIAIIAIKQEDNSYYVSMRAKNNIDISSIATAMGGGGHDQMAAFNYDGLLSDLKDTLFKLCKTELANHPAQEIEESLFDSDE